MDEQQPRSLHCHSLHDVWQIDSPGVAARSRVRMRDHHRRPARRSRGCGDHAAAARHRTPDVPLLIRHAAVRRRRQQSGAAGARSDDRRRAGRLRVVDAASTDSRSAVGRDHRGASADPRAVDVHRRTPSGPARRRGRVVGPRGRTPPTLRCVRRFRHHAAGAHARDREILLACAAGAGLGAVYSVPLGGALFAAQHTARQLASAGAGHGLDHVESRGRGRRAGHPPRAPTDWPDAKTSYLFAFLALVIAPLAGRRRPGVRPGDDRRPAESRRYQSWVLIPGDRGGRPADRHLLDLVAGTARQRAQHPDGERRQRTDARRRGASCSSETASDGGVSARGRGRRAADPRAWRRARRRDRLSHLR